tara:strand:- start:3094 stop:3669 length:576 start_codon:yes stop_codon:yes gene_type:complete
MIWAGLEVTFKSRWSGRFADPAAIDEWAAVWSYALADLTEQDVRIALAKAARESEWPPSSPAEFRQLLAPPDVPDLSEVVALVCRQDARPQHCTFEQWWIHPVVLAVATDPSVDIWNLRRMSVGQARKALEPILDRHTAAMKKGKVYAWPWEKPALETAEKQAPTDEELAATEAARQEAFAVARKLFGAKV